MTLDNRQNTAAGTQIRIRLTDRMLQARKAGADVGVCKGEVARWLTPP